MHFLGLLSDETLGSLGKLPCFEFGFRLRHEAVMAWP